MIGSENEDAFQARSPADRGAAFQRGAMRGLVRFRKL
jgi:hypothetical protein